MSIIELNRCEIANVSGGIDTADKLSIAGQCLASVLFQCGLALYSMAPHKKNDDAVGGRFSRLSSFGGELVTKRRLVSFGAGIFITLAVNYMANGVANWFDGSGEGKDDL
ncbi:MAG: hypothetical protein KKE11_04095 [Gammaproteobacteria bacterium]|nr:hypothetical protein [Gammaproteobacteria bacterium]